MAIGVAKVRAAIQHEPGSTIPRGELVIDRDFAKALIDWSNGSDIASTLSETDLLLSSSRILNLDLVCIPADNRNPSNQILSPPLTDILTIADEGLYIFYLINGAFQSAMNKLGVMTLMSAMAQNPDQVWLELQQRSQKVVATIAQGLLAGVHGIIIADDIAYNKSTYMSPDFIKRYLLPLWQNQVNVAHDLGTPIFLHSDGNVNEVLSYIVEAGFDGLQCLEPSAGMDMATVKSHCGKHLCLMGNIDPILLSESDSSSFSASNRKFLQQKVNQILALGKHSGVIIGTCSGLHKGMWPERVQYMYQIVAAKDPSILHVSP